MKNQDRKWRLQKLFDGLSDVKIPKKYQDLMINGITMDSRKVEDGFLFAALKGSNVDGSAFIAKAVEAGAVAVLCDDDGDVPDGVCAIKSSNSRRLFSLLAAKYYDTQPEIIAAVTGTNGKTSTVHFCQEIWRYLGYESASVGTVGITKSGAKFDYDRTGFLTTPDPVKLHDILAQLADSGVTRLAMEASSHGLDQFRLDGVKVKIASFTNLSRDHLDYHGNFENYLKAKMRLFAEVMQPGGVAVLNADIPEFERIAKVCDERGHTVFSYGHYKKGGRRNYIEIFKIVPTSEGQQLSFEILGKVYNINIPLIGEFQAYNLLGALGIVLASGANVDDAVAVLAKVTCVPGRMERVGDLPVFVDYAHTPDALEKALKVLRPHTKGKLWVVFGCGGDRDKGKRPLMGRIASELADEVIVTDDNPRSEKPEVIRQEIMADCPRGVEIEGRDKAIAHAMSHMQDKDVLLVAGKGHEKTQIIGDNVLPFDDVAVVAGFA